MELSTRVLYFSFSFFIWTIKVWGWKSARRVRARHSLSTGQVRGESNSPLLSLLEGSKGGLWSGVAEWMAESESGVETIAVHCLVKRCQLIRVLIYSMRAELMDF